MAIIVTIIRNGSQVFKNPQKLKRNHVRLSAEPTRASRFNDLLDKFSFEEHQKAKLDHVPRVRVVVVHQVQRVSHVRMAVIAAQIML